MQNAISELRREVQRTKADVDDARDDSERQLTRLRAENERLHHQRHSADDSLLLQPTSRRTVIRGGAESSEIEDVLIAAASSPRLRLGPPRPPPPISLDGFAVTTTLYLYKIWHGSCCHNIIGNRDILYTKVM